jgi:hypothetical protein
LNPLILCLVPPGPLLTHLRTVYMASSECLPTRLAERAPVPPQVEDVTRGGGDVIKFAGDCVIAVFPEQDYMVITRHETFSTSIQPPYSSTKG